MAFSPFSVTTISSDAALTKKTTVIPAIKNGVPCLDLEQGIVEVVFHRPGLLKKVEDAQCALTSTAGLGVHLGPFQFNLGGRDDIDYDGVLGFFSLAPTF